MKLTYEYENENCKYFKKNFFLENTNEIKTVNKRIDRNVKREIIKGFQVK